jgi:argininosuccinate synthase
MMKKKVVLAFSGGLDTSFCCIYLSRDRDLEVHSVIVNTGGFSEEELKQIEKRAYALGVTSHAVVDETLNYYESCIKYLISVFSIFLFKYFFIDINISIIDDIFLSFNAILYIKS